MRPAGARLRPDSQRLLPRRRLGRPARPARLHRGPRHHGDLADPVVQEQACAGRCRRRRAPATTATGSPTSPRSTRTSAPTPSYGELVDAAHARGIKVFFDIITNHTADVIDYDERLRRRGQPAVRRQGRPSRTATPTGTPFDDRDYADGDPAFPPSTRTLVPLHAALPADGRRGRQGTDWLNDPTMYHNRGTASSPVRTASTATFRLGPSRRSTTCGPSIPTSCDGMIDIYQTGSTMPESTASASTPSSTSTWSSGNSSRPR